MPNYNWLAIQLIARTAKLDSAYGLIQFWHSSEFFSSNYFQIGQHVVLLHTLIAQVDSTLQGKKEETEFVFVVIMNS